MRQVLRARRPGRPRRDGRGGLRRLARPGAGRASCRPPRPTPRCCAALPKRKTALTWVPWTHSRLAAASGYGAGVTSPGWYHHLFTAPDHAVDPLADPGGRGAARPRPAGLLGARHRGGPAGRGAGRAARPAAGRAGRGHRGDLGGAVRRRRAARPASSPATSSSASGSARCRTRRPTVPLEADLRAQARDAEAEAGPGGQDGRRSTCASRSTGTGRCCCTGSRMLGIGWGDGRRRPVRGTGTFRETGRCAGGPSWRSRSSTRRCGAPRWPRRPPRRSSMRRAAGRGRWPAVTRRGGERACWPTCRTRWRRCCARWTRRRRWTRT